MTPENVNVEDPVAELTRALAAAGAQPRFNRSRVAPSILYDRDYHVAIIACAIRINAVSRGGSVVRILAAWLKLLQFVAARPALVQNLQEYARTRLDGDLEKWSLMPRGYLGDRVHDGVVDFLVASGHLRRSGDYLEEGNRFGALQQMAIQIEKDKMFERERRILNELREVRPTKTLLGGT